MVLNEFDWLLIFFFFESLIAIVFYGLVGWVWSVTTYNEKKLHLTQDKQGTSNN